MKTELLPFDLEKAKNGAKLVTRDGRPARLCDIKFKNKHYPLLCFVEVGDGKELPETYTLTGKYDRKEDANTDFDLFIEEEEKEKPQREYSGTDSIYVPKDDEGIRKELIDAIHGLWNNEALPMPLTLKRKMAWITWLKKQEEQKTKIIIPKFRVGDLIVQDNVGIYKVTEICESWYEVIDSDGTNYSISFDNEPMCHLWTIQDAKPGDILASKNGENILIFRQITSGTGFSSYYNTREAPNVGWSNDFFIPATKEQHDLLFQKMKETGDEWNSDKKELHKIEEAKTRKMTNQELSDWLRDCPEEHREYTYADSSIIRNNFAYCDEDASKSADDILVRRNHGEWQKPLIDIK